MVSRLVQAFRARARDLSGHPGRYGPADEGFTLIELMVVLLIMAILLAIAIPTFLGVKGGASDRSAQSNLDTAVKEAIGVYGNTQSFATGFQAAGPELTWNNDAGGSDFPATLGSGTNLVHAGGSTVSYWVGDAATSGDNLALVLAAYSKCTQTCWYVAQLEATPANAEIGGTDSASFTSTSGATTPGTFYAQQQNATDCQASLAIDPFSWGKSWGSAPNNVASGTTTTTTPPSSGLSPLCTGSNIPVISSATATGTSSNVVLNITGSNLTSAGEITQNGITVQGNVLLYGNANAEYNAQDLVLAAGTYQIQVP